MATALATKPHQRSHSGRRLVVPAWEAAGFDTPYAFGGKGYGLRRLMELGLPVPPALVISTTLSRSYLEHGRLPKRFLEQLQRELTKLERKTGRRFGEPKNPLLVSVRSGAMTSMPGMMETILNVGLTREVEQTLKNQAGAQFVADCRRHLRKGLSINSDLDDLRTDDAWGQLLRAIELVLESWNSPEAQAYRLAHGISDKLGTAITIQEMVFGNLKSGGESGTGVVMSHNPESAESMLYGNYLPLAQGHDLVSGEKTPLPISDLTAREPAISAELERALTLLQQETNYPVEMEFTVENGRLYLLQYRQAKLSPEAKAIYLVREKHAGRITREQVVEQVTEQMIEKLTTGARLGVSIDTIAAVDKIGRGEGITHGAASGEIATTSEEVAACRARGVAYILVRRETTPEDFPLMLGAAGIITAEGGETCHAAVVARHQGISAVIGVGEEVYDCLTNVVTKLFPITIDAFTGWVLRGKLPLSEPQYGKEVGLLLRWCKQQSIAPVIVPERCSQRFSVNTFASNFYLLEALLLEATGEVRSRALSLKRQLLTEIVEVFGTYLALAVSSEVTYARGYTDLNDSLQRLKERFFVVHRSAWQSNCPNIIATLHERGHEETLAFFRECRIIFEHSCWGRPAAGSGGVGGFRWAEIAQTGELFWSGKLSPEVFVDRVFDLEHNGGRVFSKHSMVSSWNELRLRQQLDAKRTNKKGVRALYEQLMRVHHVVHPEVAALIEKGGR